MYRARVMDGVIERRLRSAGAILLDGPKASGKTCTAEQHTAGHVYLGPDASARAALAVDPPWSSTVPRRSWSTSGSSTPLASGTTSGRRSADAATPVSSCSPAPRCPRTAYDYLDALRRLMVLDELTPWAASGRDGLLTPPLR